MARLDRLTWAATLLAVALNANATAPPADLIKDHLRTGDYEAAERLLRPLAEQGDPEAAYELGRLYRQQRIPGRSREAALALFREAAAAGHASARQQLRRLEASVPASTSTSAQQALQECDVTALEQALQARAAPTADLLLHRALVCAEAAALLKTLLAAGYPDDETDASGNTPLHLAVARGATAAARVLVESGASTEAVNANGWTPRMLAARGDSEALQTLFDGPGAPAEAHSGPAPAVAQEGQFAGWPLLSVAAWRNELTVLRRLLADGADPDAGEPSALSRALLRGHGAAATLLLEHGATVRSDRELERLTALNEPPLLAALLQRQPALLHDAACQALAADAAALLEIALARGWNPARRCGDSVPLVTAARTADAAMVAMLLAGGAEVDAADDSGCTALCWSLRRQRHDIADRLLAAGATQRPDALGISPLMLAAGAGDGVMVRRLLRHGAAVDRQSRSGSHALLLAAEAGHAETVDLLLKHEAKVNLRNAVGDTALICAVRNGHKSVARRLLAAGASARAQNDRFETARKLALAKNDDTWRELIESRPGLWRMLGGG